LTKRQKVNVFKI